MNLWISLISDFIRQHQMWGIPIVFLLTFGESLAVLSLILPATIILLGLGALIGETGISFWPIYCSALAGGFFGDWLSYWVGSRYQERIYDLPPFSRHPSMLKRGQVFFIRWGVIGVFFGRFLGPLRAVVPIVAGFCGMSSLEFQLANFISAAFWTFWLLLPGAFGLHWLEHFVDY